MGKADLHAHTCHDAWGDGNDTVERLFRFVEEETDLDLVAITDHDSSDAARVGWEMHQHGTYRFGFVPGVEVTNLAGHLLCYFPSGEIHEVPSLRPFWWTVRYVHERGGLCVPAHPVYPPWLAGTIRRGLAAGQHLDAIEVVNAGIPVSGQSKLDALFDDLHDRIALVANSDAHEASMLGAAYTEFPGHTMDDFLRALRSRQTKPVFRHRPTMHPDARRFTTRRSMTHPGWVRNLWREARGRR